MGERVSGAGVFVPYRARVVGGVFVRGILSMVCAFGCVPGAVEGWAMQGLYVGVSVVREQRSE